MTDEFYNTKRQRLMEMRNEGQTAMTALHWLEVQCGKFGEEFKDEGRALVELVYDAWTHRSRRLSAPSVSLRRIVSRQSWTFRC